MSELARAILRNDAATVQKLIQRLGERAAGGSPKSAIAVQLPPDAIHGLGWLLPRIENTLRRSARLNETSEEVLAGWGAVLRHHVGTEDASPPSLPAESVLELLVSIPLTMEAQGSICSGAVRRHLAAFAEACVRLLHLDSIEEPVPCAPPRGLRARVRHFLDVVSACVVLGGILAFVVYAVSWREVHELCHRYGLL